MRKNAPQIYVSGVSEIKGVSANLFRGDAAWGHRRPCSHGETLSSRPRRRKMCLRLKHCLWGRQSATLNPAEEWEGSSLASTAATTDKVVKARTAVVTAATTVADESCARAAAANDKPAGLE